jgi:hypothetical protein
MMNNSDDPDGGVLGGPTAGAVATPVEGRFGCDVVVELFVSRFAMTHLPSRRLRRSSTCG